ncbi:hypothetical protein Catovirus_2_290 [Catovirus CTV1]|uniref:Uncharacterized protein n=1 Tax=Catovirus CTV1 TaxID=1977631 RepID=A0A1V0SCC6_9VIRU|nr:hypothetical protein Catovirus_2_290 [Catovirus CTV1]
MNSDTEQMSDAIRQINKSIDSEKVISSDRFDDIASSDDYYQYLSSYTSEYSHENDDNSDTYSTMTEPSSISTIGPESDIFKSSEIFKKNKKYSLNRSSDYMSPYMSQNNSDNQHNIQSIKYNPIKKGGYSKNHNSSVSEHSNKNTESSDSIFSIKDNSSNNKKHKQKLR